MWNAGCFINQKANREPTMNALFTHDAVPIHGCPSINEYPHFQNTFLVGDTIHCAAYYHDQLQGDTTYFRLRRPDNTVYTSWQHNSPNTYTSSWWRWRRIIASGEPLGVWQLEADYKGFTQIHSFNYGVFPASAISLKNDVEVKVYPNPSEGNVLIEFVTSKSAHYNVTVYDAMGKKVSILLDNSLQKKSLQKLQLSNHLNAKGLYFIAIYQNGQLVNQKSLMLQ